VEEVRAIANRKHADVADVVLAWYLTRHSIDVLIPGAKKPEQVSRNLQALDVSLTMDEIAEISAIFA
jgi:aryl-alcohol dehydrogenase-like predicted oxidoreductase